MEVRPLEDRDALAHVFVFLRTDCPISNRYAPELRRLHDDFEGRQLRFWMVYVDPEEPVERIGEHVEAFGFPGRILRDPRHELVRRVGAGVTPEAAVLLRDGRQVYRGRIDDRWVAFGKARAEPTRRDLEEALDAVLAGRTVREATTQAVGCFIRDVAARTPDGRGP